MFCLQYFRASNTICPRCGGTYDEYVSQKNILELNVDCCEELFEWLTLSDLKALRQTCKRLKTIVDHHIKSQYPKGFGTFHVFKYNDSKYLHSCNLSFDHVSKHFHLTPRTSSELIEDIKPNLSGIDIVSIGARETKVDLFKNVLPLCTNMTHLQINYGGDEWLHHLPSLQHLSISNHGPYPLQSITLQSFFQLNLNIRRFSTQADILIRNKNWMKVSNIHLDELDIQCFEEENMTRVCRLLNILFERGFYKRLSLFLWYEEQGSFDSIESLKGLEILYFYDGCELDFVNTPMPQVKELRMNGFITTKYDVFNTLVDSFMNIERLNFTLISLDIILPFIHRSTKLKMIKIEFLEEMVKVNRKDDGNYFEKGIIDLPALNRERMKCAGASKIAIYVEEGVYLKTKEAFMRTSFSLIELKRFESLVWELQFDEVFDR